MNYILKHQDSAATYYFSGRSFTACSPDLAVRFPTRDAAEKFALRWEAWPYDSREIRAVLAPMPTAPAMTAAEHNRFPKGRWS